MPDPGRVLYAERDGTFVLRFEGTIRYTMAPSIDAFLDRLLATGPPRTICADLSETESIDSTGIGLLAKIAIAERRAGRGKPLLFSSRREISEVLCSVCLDRVFDMVEGAPEADGLTPLTATEPGERELARTIFETHCLLCELSEGNRAMFRDVVEELAKEVGDAAAGGSGRLPDR